MISASFVSAPTHTTSSTNMKLIVLFCLVAVALAQDEKDAEIIRNDYQLNEDGSFTSDVETSNSIRATVTGQSFPGSEPETGSYTMSGSYSYITPDGAHVEVTWSADESGYQAVF